MGTKRTDNIYRNVVNCSAWEHFLFQTAEVSESADPQAERSSCRHLEKNGLFRTNSNISCIREIDLIKSVDCGFTHVHYGTEAGPSENTVLHFPSMTHRMGISKADMRGKCLLLHRAPVATEGAVSPGVTGRSGWLNNENNDSDGRQR